VAGRQGRALGDRSADPVCEKRPDPHGCPGRGDRGKHQGVGLDEPGAGGRGRWPDCGPRQGARRPAARHRRDPGDGGRTFGAASLEASRTTTSRCTTAASRADRRCDPARTRAAEACERKPRRGEAFGDVPRRVDTDKKRTARRAPPGGCIVDSRWQACSKETPNRAAIASMSWRSACADARYAVSAATNRLGLGDRLRLIPGHCDPTVNLYE
jgi:hypothetical protein